MRVFESGTIRYTYGEHGTELGVNIGSEFWLLGFSEAGFILNGGSTN